MTMRMTTVDFYFDYLSPYAYLASLQIPELCSHHGVGLRLRPVLFAGLLNHWGQRGPAEIPPKGMHTAKECMRYARLRGLPFRPPLHHPFNPLTALRVSLREVSGNDQPRVMATLYDLGWRDGGDMGDAVAIQEALDAAGLPGATLLQRAGEPEAKERLRSETEAATDRGVFGIPTMLVGDELFWGLDQLPNLELYLQGKDPLAGVDWSAYDFRGRSAWRTGVSRDRFDDEPTGE